MLCLIIHHSPIPTSDVVSSVLYIYPWLRLCLIIHHSPIPTSDVVSSVPLNGGQGLGRVSFYSLLSDIVIMNESRLDTQ